MKFLSNLPIKYKLVLVLAPLVIAIGISTLLDVASLRATVDAGSSIVRLTQLSKQNSSLVHELQKERGLTAAFLGSNDNSFQNKLQQQRQLTDEKLAAWRDFLNGNSADITEQKVNNDIAKVKSGLEKLMGVRNEVFAREISTASALSYYTGMNSNLLAVAATIAEYAEKGAMARQILNYEEFLQGKERAGIERAVLSNTFAADKFGPGMFQRFVTLVADQNTYLLNFQKTATAQASDIYNEYSSHPSFERVENYRQIAFQNNQAGGFNVVASEWFDSATARINQLKTIEDELAQLLVSNAKANLSSAERALWTNIFISTILIVVTTLLALFIVGGINRQLTSLTHCISKVANENDLAIRAEINSEDEVGQVARSVNEMLDTLVHLVKSINNASTELAQAAEEIATTIEQSNQNMLTQQDETAQLVAAINQLAAASQEVASNTQNTAGAASDANSTAIESDEVVLQAVQAIDGLSKEVEQVGEIIQKLNESSVDINSVLDVIKSVAEQTNLLALNAAIEAARAGEQGRGFAVVADEVRTLAQRTQHSAQEIEEIITKFQSEAEMANKVIIQGRSTAGDAVQRARSIAEVLQDISQSITTIHDLTHQIASATEEQVSVNEEVNKNIVRIDSMGQQNAAGFNQIMSSTREQAELAGDLQSLVCNFKV